MVLICLPPGFIVAGAWFLIMGPEARIEPIIEFGSKIRARPEAGSGARNLGLMKLAPKALSLLDIDTCRGL